MASQVRDPESKRLVRGETDSDLEPEVESKPKLELQEIAQEIAQEISLSDIFYASRTTLLSYFGFT